MKSSMPGLALVLFVFTTWPMATYAYDSETEAEFHVDYEYQKDRVADFYTRLNEIEKADLERRKGENEKRAERKKMAYEQEAARREFVKERKARPEEDDSSWQAEVKARQQQYERARQNYVMKRNEAQKKLRKYGQVPEADEYDLYFEEVD